MRILELTLQAADLETLLRYYIGVLGLRAIESGTPGRLVLQAGATRLTFVSSPAGALPAGQQPRYHFAFDVPVARFEAALGWLSQRGRPIASTSGQTHFHGGWNADSVYFSDPQGNILELIARRTVPAPASPLAGSEQPFTAAEIIAVTEIGLAADTVAGAVGTLTARIPGLEVYDGAGSDTFTAVGDHFGLLIVVRRGRIWFPDTGVPAEALPLTVVVETEPGARCRITAPPFPFEVAPAG